MSWSTLPDAINEACARADMRQIQDYLTAADESQRDKILADMALVAIETPQDKVLEFCLRAGATPLFRLGIRAIYVNNLPAYKALMSAGLDINEDYDTHGDALICAVNIDNIPFATYLLDNGAELQNPLPFSQNARLRQDRYGALGLAAMVASQQMIAFLLSRGAKIENSLALHLAASMERIEIMQQLLAAGADINESPTAEYHNTSVCDYRLGPPLFFAVDYRRTEAVTFLLDHGADATLLDRAGRNILERAKLEGPGLSKQRPYPQEWPELIESLRERDILIS